MGSQRSISRLNSPAKVSANCVSTYVSRAEIAHTTTRIAPNRTAMRRAGRSSNAHSERDDDASGADRYGLLARFSMGYSVSIFHLLETVGVAMTAPSVELPRRDRQANSAAATIIAV